MKHFVTIVALCFLAGCTEARIYTDAAIRATKEGKDLSAEVLSEAPCAMGLGAFDRLNTSPEKKRAIAALCLENTLPVISVRVP